MKKIVRIFVVASLLITFSCKKEVDTTEETTTTTTKSLEENAKVPKTKVAFDKEIHDFGEIEQGEIVETTFLIKNVGDKNLYIVDAHGSCGCTVPEVTKEAIKPGESAPISVKFDSNGKSGEVTKTVMITCNTAKVVENIKIKASIKTKK
ncbi:MAG: hypothetical protein A3G95_07420 [Flavobacteria bacterium RIFCSPLOWO2_12_FULL_31_7]|nr:MAG: hypothetical protein A3G95_07420 [Flavobacteria bacterium RIFCSPLOWO2_12_FULL_31_7]